MTTYSNTGNTLAYGIDSTIVANYLSSLPHSETGVPVSEVGKTDGSTVSPTTNVLIVDAGSTVGVHADASSYVLVGDNSTVDFSSSADDAGKQIQLNITVSGGNNSLLLNKGSDLVQSTTGNDTIQSSGGHDTINGGSGHDVIIGGGHSSITGGSGGGDTLVGGQSTASHDTIVSGSNGGALISTPFGHNVIIGNTNDTIRAGQSQDTISAGSGAETITGGHGAVIIGGGHSSIGGGNGNYDYLRGHDTLVSGASANTAEVYSNAHVSIQGGAGALDVTLHAGKHDNDTIFGGSGGLTIHVSNAFGAIVSDKTIGDDGTHVLKFAGGETLTVNNVTIDFGHHAKPL